MHEKVAFLEVLEHLEQANNLTLTLINEVSCPDLKLTPFPSHEYF